MATGTGMQTGMRTGSAPLPTGARPGPGGGTPLAKVTQFFQGMSPKQKIIGGVVLAVIIIGAISFSMYSKASAFVPLYDTKLAPSDVKEITMKLTEMNIEYEVGEGASGIMVPPAVRNKARIQLASYGLPKRQIGKGGEGDGLAPKTADDKRYERMQTLEGDLTESIRQVEGVADAYVKIVKPDTDYFNNDQKPTTAAVMLRLQPGGKLTNSQIKGIVHLVAFSVEGLKPENVKVLDTKGFILNENPAIAGNGDDPSVMTSQQQDKKVSFENQLKTKVQGMLDEVLGPNKAKVVVNATLDFSSSETETLKVGGPGNTTGMVKEKEKVETELFTSAPGEKGGGGSQMSFKGSTNTGDNANYKKEDKTVIYKSDMVKKRTVTPPGRVERLTASVMVDNLKPDQVTKITSVVKDAIGADEARGDSVTVASMPFNNGFIEDMNYAMSNKPPVAANKPNPINGSYLPYLTGAFMVVLLIPVLVFLARQKRVQTEKSKLILATGPGATASDISDLISDKVGRSTAPPDTRVNTTEQLEKLAKEKPTKVAELLKSTWLAEKER